MRNLISNLSKWLAGAIMALAVLLTAILMLKSSSNMATNVGGAMEKIGVTMNLFFIVTYTIIFLTILLVLAFSVSNLFIKPKGAKNSLLGVGILLVIIVLSYFISSSYVDPEFAERVAGSVNLTPALSKKVGTGLIATYILGALSILAIVYSSVSKLIKG